MILHLTRSSGSALTTLPPRLGSGLFLHSDGFPTCSVNPTTTRRWLSDERTDEEQNHIRLHSYEREPTISILTLNRPNRANAMGSMMLQQLQDALYVLSKESTSATRCVVLTSASSKVFSAGADLKERLKMSQDEAADFVTNLRNTMNRLATLPMPVIASIEGVAVGGGLEIALAADIRVARVNATFGLPETTLAIIPGAGGTQRLPRLIGVARAKELIFTGKRINAQTALEYGLVQHVVEDDAEKKALEIALDIVKNGPLGIRAAKDAIERGMEAPTMTDALEIEREGYQKVIPTLDRLEGLEAFRQGRKPVYKGE